MVLVPYGINPNFDIVPRVMVTIIYYLQVNDSIITCSNLVILYGVFFRIIFIVLQKLFNGKVLIYEKIIQICGSGIRTTEQLNISEPQSTEVTSSNHYLPDRKNCGLFRQEFFISIVVSLAKLVQFSSLLFLSTPPIMVASKMSLPMYRRISKYFSSKCANKLNFSLNFYSNMNSKKTKFRRSKDLSREFHLGILERMI
ncbi:hypothetical protein BpHYR1_043577 [Brachionus plicatilis]|uniref:Uncharacterized protein n=1 Tax=Brachionus plicatilis TaxID=10195 RepID=A0A3M7SNF3_BRAPC|nr:hypothetical protein BpHYR1_043577 [Brachionus plicatilis]